MRRSSLTIIICLAGACVLGLIFHFYGTIPPMVLPALSSIPAPVTSIVPPSPKPLQIPVKTTVPGTAATEKSTPLPGITDAGESIAGDPYTISTPVLEQRVHELINQERTSTGLGALRFDPELADIARGHSEDMATRNYFAHVNPAGQDPTARGTAAGYICRKNYGSYYTYGIAENLFQNNLYSSVTYYSNRETEYDWNSPEVIAEVTVAGWMNSSGHRENILTPTFDREGIGIAIGGDDKVYITEDFC